MLESVSERLMETVHAGSPTKHPARRLETIAAAGELKIPFTSGILVGIGESEQERVESLEALAAVHAEHGHIQEVILQNFVPHQRYYGEEPAQIADAAARAYWRTGVADGRPRLRAAGVGVPGEHRGHEAADRRDAAADAGRGHPDPAQPGGLVGGAGVGAGATDLGGLSANGDHISPEHPFPSPHQVRKQLAARGLRADRAAVRVPAVHRPRVDRAGSAGHDQGEVLELHPAARVRAHGRARADPPRARGRRDREGPRRACAAARRS